MTMTAPTPPATTHRTDVNAFVGGYPYRHVPHPDPDALLRVMDREGIAEAWVGHLPSAWYRDPSPGNAELRHLLHAHKDRLLAVPVVRPDWPRWREQVRSAADQGVVAVRAYPSQWGFGPDDGRMIELAEAAAAAQMAVVLTVKFEDVRQRHAVDTVGDLPAAAVRQLARAGTGARLVVTAAGREFIEEVHWGLTSQERDRVFWDVSWIWGPPEDHFAHLLRTIGAERFVFGTMWPLRLAQVARANIALLPTDVSATLADVSRWR
ncbi:MAG: hypothetical protein U0163_02110 [Gemmatimonadaceae bacterium]